MVFGWSLHAKERKRIVVVSSFMRHRRQECFNVYMLHAKEQGCVCLVSTWYQRKKERKKYKLSPSWACGCDLGPKRKEEKEKGGWASNRPKKENKEK